ncbi:hypothetical protein OK016_25575 [Vibrio chagasii]|nr:hypothetical protein [Vibrio chagasii]
MTMGARKGTGNLELVDIEENQLETCTTFGSKQTQVFLKLWRNGLALSEGR